MKKLEKVPRGEIAQTVKCAGCKGSPPIVVPTVSDPPETPDVYEMVDAPEVMHFCAKCYKTHLDNIDVYSQIRKRTAQFILAKVQMPMLLVMAEMAAKAKGDQRPIEVIMWDGTHVKLAELAIPDVKDEDVDKIIDVWESASRAAKVAREMRLRAEADRMSDEGNKLRGN
jgi:hypothetical protein